MRIVFLGTNGWFNTGTGNTPCVLVETEDYYIVFDAGDGIYKLDRYIKSDKPIYIFLSHFHLDHLSGLHILNKFRFKQGLRLYGQKGTKVILHHILAHPLSVPLEDLPTKLNISELTEGTHRIPFRLTCKLLLHADPCFGYRVVSNGKVIAYCTDTGICENSLKLARNADVLIHDCAETSGARTSEWPHSTPVEAATLAKEANVRQLILFHFSAAVYQSIEDRKKAKADAKVVFKNTIASVDGMEITF